MIYAILMMEILPELAWQETWYTFYGKGNT